jgi:hypothetical protein
MCDCIQLLTLINIVDNVRHQLRINCVKKDSNDAFIPQLKLQNSRHKLRHYTDDDHSENELQLLLSRNFGSVTLWTILGDAST